MKSNPTDRFWAAAKHIIDVTEHHPFLEAMVYGTLPNNNFAYYVIQDSLYLGDFADCLRRLSQNSDVPSKEDSDRLEHFARGAEEEERSLHNSFFKEWGLGEQATDAKPMPNTTLYTSYMMRIVATQDHAEGLAVLLPCLWVYMHVGKCMLALREKLGDTVKRSPQFDAWIDMYGGDDFEKEVRDYIGMVNRVAANADEKKLAKMEEHFIMSCTLEHMFWDQAMDTMKWPSFEKK
jgi:thiaminase/transcriptional activator TenA